jgi:succinate dehydrogenase / fumarate reductase, cytochrome b subunit
MNDVREVLMTGRNSEGKLIRRPLSPHLQVYKPQMSSTTSIFHRGTGIVLGIGAILLTYWLVTAATAPSAFVIAQTIFASWVGKLVLFGFNFCLCYHFCNGIRHLFWDMGRGFELPAMHRSGRLMIGAAVVLTIVIWILASVL